MLRWDARTTVSLVAAGVVLAVAVLASAVGGSWELEERDLFSGTPRMQEPPPAPDGGAAPMDVAPPPASSFGWGWAERAGWVLLALLALAAAVWLTAWLWQRRGGPRPPQIGADGVATAAVEEPELPVLRRGVAAAQRFLEEIERPTDAIIAAWLALEEATSTSGVRRAPAQTPTEFTVAVLERTDADAEATTELLALYHRARFSADPIEPDAVARASRCLARLAASFEVLAPTDRGTA